MNLNTSEIGVNRGLINTNTTDISTNAENIEKHSTKIATNAGDILNIQKKITETIEPDIADKAFTNKAKRDRID